MPSISTEKLAEMDEEYNKNCDSSLMRAFHRNVSCHNPFSKENSPPIEHLQEDTSIQQKINKIDVRNVPRSLKPLAGKFT